MGKIMLGNIMGRVAVFFVRAYQQMLSPYLGCRCRFTPSCSAYAIAVFEQRGFWIGLGKTCWRLLRCQPFCAGGYDPPEAASCERMLRR